MEENKDQFDYSIAVTRIIGCIMIFLCHYIQIIGKPVIAQTAQFFNVGVFVFFMISGYLYGQRKIDKGALLNWYKKRIIKIFVPLYIVMIIIFIALYFQNVQVEPMRYLMYALNLQAFGTSIPGAAQLWFLTAIMLCYIITPLLQFLRENHSRKILCIIAVVYIALQLIMALMGVSYVALYMIYIGIYIAAYFIFPLMLEQVTKKKVIVISILMIVAMLARIMGKVFVDGTYFYDYIIVLYTHTILGIWIILLVKYMYTLIGERLKREAIKHINKYTMEIYMVHMMFMHMPFCMMGRINLVVDTILIIICTVISAWILKKVENFVINQIS